MLSNPSLRSHKNLNENFKLKRNLRWPTTRTLDLPSSTRGHGGSLLLIGRSVQNLLQWTSVCSWLTPYMEDWRRNWRLSLCYFTSGTTITSACFVFAGNLINPSRLSDWNVVFNEDITQGVFLHWFHFH